MTDLTRRRFGQLFGGLAALATTRAFAASPAARVIVIGGGFAGATCAKYLAQAAPDAAVTLIDPAGRYVTCPFSNTVLGGFASMNAITVDRGDASRQGGATFVEQRVAQVDPVAKRVVTETGETFEADLLVVSPGIGFDLSRVEGYGPDTGQKMPHAWKAGAQTALLREKLVAMPDGGRVVISIPPAPYRCPPGPFERASLIAQYLTLNKPRSKVVLLNASGAMPKGELFQEGWEILYPGMIEHLDISASPIVRIDPDAMTLSSEFDTFEGDVVNFIPPQRAGAIAASADLTDEQGWCPVKAPDFESTRYPGVFVLGDAARSPLPKSASAGTTAAKVCAHAIATRLTGQDFGPPSFINACYSLLAPDYAIAVGAVYRARGDSIERIQEASGASPLNASRDYRRKEAEDARSWYASIVADSFG